MKWNGRSYRPVAGIPLKKKPFDFQEALKPLGEKDIPVWSMVMNVEKEPPAPPVSPSPTPTKTATPTPTVTISSSSTPTPTVTATVTPTITSSSTPTPTVTATVTPTITSSSTPTPTPSSTPSVGDCAWSATSVNWESNVNDWDVCAPQPSPSPTPTSTSTPTVTPTSTVTPTTSVTPTPSVTVSPTASVTPTVTPTNTVTPTPSVTATITPTPSVTVSVTPSITASSTPTVTPTPSSTPPALTGQTEAQTYMSAVIAGGGTLNATMSGATYQLFNDLFVAGLWSKLYSFYPLLGGNSSGGQAVNGKTPGTRNITWNGGLTFSTNGVVSNGTTGYGDLNSNPNNIGGLNDFHMSFYSRTDQQVSTAQFDMGAYDNPNQRTQLNSRSTLDDVRGVVNAITQGTFSNTNSQGMYTVVRRTSTDTEFYKNSTSLGNSNTTSTARPNGDLFLAARNWINGGGLVESPTTRQYAFVTTGNALTDGEVTSLYNAIQTFQTTLGRQV